MNVFTKFLLMAMIALPMTLSAFIVDFRDPGKWGEPLGAIGVQPDTSQTNAIHYPVTVTVTSMPGIIIPARPLWRDNLDGFGISGGIDGDELDDFLISGQEKLRVHFSAPVLIKEIFLTDLFFGGPDVTSGGVPYQESAGYSFDDFTYHWVNQTTLHPLAPTGGNGELLVSGGLTLPTITSDLYFKAPHTTLVDLLGNSVNYDFSVGYIKACIPEPSTYLLLGSTLMIAAVMRRKRVTA